MEVGRVRQPEGGALHSFLLKEHRAGRAPLHLISGFWVNDPAGIAIATFEGKAITHLFLTEVIEGSAAVTREVLGPIGPWTRDVLDGLCATCTSFPAPIVSHCFVLRLDQVKSFDEVFKECRLGRFQVDRHEQLLDPAGQSPDLFVSKFLWKHLTGPRLAVRVLIEYPTDE